MKRKSPPRHPSRNDELERETRAIIRNMEERSKDIEAATKSVKRARLRFLEERKRKHQLDPLTNKSVEVGPRGGMYYINRNGQKTYLTRGQQRRCKQGKLHNIKGGCPPEPKMKRPTRY
jgi:hypothetical protein